MRMFPDTSNPVARIITRTNLAALALSLALAGVVFILIRFSQTLSAPDSPPLTVREVTLSLPPPPPPPPPQQQNKAQQSLSLDLGTAGSGPALDIPMPDVKQSLDMIEPPPPMQSIQATAWDKDLSIDWSAFTLDQLDALPQVVALQEVPFPNDLSRRNIHRVVLKLDVFIDETGQVSLVEVIENPHPDILGRTIQRIVQSTRFSPPTRGGKPVRARFIWPLEIKE